MTDKDRLIALVLSTFLFTVLLGCGGHTAAIRRAFAETGTPCQEVSFKNDPKGDGYVLRAQGCGREAWCWWSRPTNKLRCDDLRPDEIRDARAREALRCPEGKLEERDAPDWKTAIIGCDRVTWCTEVHTDNGTCTAPEDLALAAKQLSVETGCPVESIEQLQFFGLQTQHTYRLNACGHQFSCVVPIVQEGRAGSRFGSQLTCKPVPATAATPPPN